MTAYCLRDITKGMKGFGSVSHVPDWRLSRALGVEQHKILWNHCHGTEEETKWKWYTIFTCEMMKNDKPKLLRSCPPQGLVQIPKKKSGKYSCSVKQRNMSLEGGEGW